MFVGSLIVYSWASERMPWLILHPLLPLVLLAGIGGAGALAEPAAGSPARLGLARRGCWARSTPFRPRSVLSFARPADPRELLVFTQTSTDVPKVRDEILALERRASARFGRPLTIEIDSWGGTGWPWGWYLRDVPAGYPDMSAPGFVPSAQVVLVAEPNHAQSSSRT